MKKWYILFFVFVNFSSKAQEHYAGIGLSRRVGILNTLINPAELCNMASKFDIHFFGVSTNVSNNKLSISDIVNNDAIGDILFQGTSPVNLRSDVQVNGLGLGFKFKRWALGINSKIYGNLDIIDVDPRLGDAFVNAGVNSLVGSSTVTNNFNQRINGTSWGELSATASINIVSTERHLFNLGFTGKFLFPGAFANMGLDQFSGTISRTGTTAYLTNTQAALNFAYSGELANSFTRFENYKNSALGALNGFGFDFGINYQWRDTTKNNPNRYKLNLGLAIRNLGAMTFDDPNNQSTNYTISIQGTQSLNLNQFESIESVKDIESILLNSGYLTKTTGRKDFRVKLPSTFVLYGDIKLISKLYLSTYVQHRLKGVNRNDQLAVQNHYTVTPHLDLGFFEFFVPFTHNEIAGFNTGLGIRAGGFYLGSGTGITALINDSQQADLFLGWRIGIY